MPPAVPPAPAPAPAVPLPMAPPFDAPVTNATVAQPTAAPIVPIKNVTVAQPTAAPVIPVANATVAQPTPAPAVPVATQPTVIQTQPSTVPTNAQVQYAQPGECKYNWIDCSRDRILLMYVHHFKDFKSAFRSNLTSAITGNDGSTLEL